MLSGLGRQRTQNFEGGRLGKRLLSRPKELCSNNMKMGHRELGCQGGNWTELDQGSIQRRTLVAEVLYTGGLLQSLLSSLIKRTKSHRPDDGGSKDL
jgi:hypothetical protein